MAKKTKEEEKSIRKRKGASAEGENDRETLLSLLSAAAAQISLSCPKRHWQEGRKCWQAEKGKRSAGKGEMTAKHHYHCHRRLQHKIHCLAQKTCQKERKKCWQSKKTKKEEKTSGKERDHWQKAKK